MATVLVYSTVNPLVLICLVDIIASGADVESFEFCLEELAGFTLRDLEEFLGMSADGCLAQCSTDIRPALGEVISKLAKPDFQIAEDVLASSLLVGVGEGA